MFIWFLLWFSYRWNVFEFPPLFVTNLPLCTMQEKDYTIIMTIYCDFEEF